MKKKFYVGLAKDPYTDCRYREVFPCAFLPTEETHGHQYGAVVGPYRSRKEAESKIALM